MLLGSEQYLKGSFVIENDACENPSEMSTIYSGDSDPWSDPIDDVTIDDLDTTEAAAPSKTLKPVQNGLMSLLSGNQNSKEKPAKRRTNNVPKTSKTDLQNNNCSSIDTRDEAEISFDASEFEKNVQKRQEIEELEKKIFSTGRSVSLRDFLKSKDTPRTIETSQDNSIINISSDDLEPETLPDKESSDDVCIVEEKQATKRLQSLFPASTTKRATNLFDTFTSKRAKNAKNQLSLKVCLRLPPAKLAVIEQFEDPFKTRGNASSGNSMISALMRKKPSTRVTIKLPKHVLQRFSESTNPLITKSSGNQRGKNAKSVFSMMMKSASHNSVPKLTAIQKLKILYPPSIPRNQLHVHFDVKKISGAVKPKPTKRKHAIDLTGMTMNDFEIDKSSAWNNYIPDIPRYRFDTTASNPIDLIQKHAPLAFTSLPHKTIYTEFINAEVCENKFLNWAQKFQPKEIKSLLINDHCRQSLEGWIANAFAILETQSTKTPRNVKIRELQKKQRKREAMAENFIVDDLDEDDNNFTDEDVFVPILIIQGDHGSGKSASVYAAMSVMDGYVHEVNTGQTRSRKEIHSSLKEFCTTQIIHQNHDEKKFQKGLVLFEDSDVLFEQDRTFWTVVQEVTNYSKRPIVVTVQDINAVPKNILDLAEEQNSVINFQMSPQDDVKQYLWLCAFSEGISLAPEVLETIVSNCQTKSGTDLRKALMVCQWVCRIDGPKSKIRHVSRELFDSPPKNEEDLESMVNKLDALSVADVIDTNTHSSIEHEVQVNELVDVYAIDESLHLHQKTLPHELNIGRSIAEALDPGRIVTTTPIFSYNEVRTLMLNFVSSRARKVPRFIQELYGLRVQTRSRSSEEFMEERPETQGLPETSVCYSMTPSAFLMEFSPLVRYWAGFQKAIFAMDVQKPNLNKKMLQDFLGWRKFYNDVDEVLKTGLSKQHI